MMNRMLGRESLARAEEKKMGSTRDRAKETRRESIERLRGKTTNDSMSKCSVLSTKY
jgi:hypothetical protein